MRNIPIPRQEPLRLLENVDLDVGPGESIAIMGVSGSGKSSLLAILGLLAVPGSGQVTVHGQRVTGISDRRRARARNKHIGFVFQSYSLVRHLNAFQNVELPLLYGERIPKRERIRRVRQALSVVGLENRQRSRPRQLSGGEQQRVAIARALVSAPSIILADEPTGALDVSTAETVLEVLFDACRQNGCALVIVTHDKDVAARAQRVLLLANGTLTKAAAT